MRRGEAAKGNEEKKADWKNAIQHYSEALKLDPQNKQAEENRRLSKRCSRSRETGKRAAAEAGSTATEAGPTAAEARSTAESARSAAAESTAATAAEAGSAAAEAGSAAAEADQQQQKQISSSRISRQQDQGQAAGSAATEAGSAAAKPGPVKAGAAGSTATRPGSGKAGPAAKATERRPAATEASFKDQEQAKPRRDEKVNKSGSAAEGSRRQGRACK